jgi:PAS domain-containing protein
VFNSVLQAVNLCICILLLFGLYYVKKLIDERRLEERITSENRVRLQFLSDLCPQAVGLLNSESRFVLVNSKFSNLFKFSPLEITGKYLHEVVGSENYFAFMQPMDAVLRGESLTTRIELDLQDSQKRRLSCSYVPDFGSDAKVKGFYLVLDQSEKGAVATNVLSQSSRD